MNYQETIEYLYASAPMFQKIGAKAYKEGLENTYAIDARLGHPHRKYRTIHVAGTNGKGSVSHTLAAILAHAGCKVGLYTSPHLLDFRERIRVNGEMMDERFVVSFVEQHKDFFTELQPSFFEVTTGMAFKYFERQKVDVAVIEVGMGGRLDCTNILSPDLSVITNISFDHMAFLGNTLPAIAREKAGIIKHCIPVVIGEAQGEVKEVFVNKAKQEEAPIYFAEEENLIRHSEILPSGEILLDTTDYPDLKDELGGFAQKKNAATLLAALRILKKEGYSICSEDVYYGFAHVMESTGLRGRWQIIANHPKTVLDTGHNSGGFEYIAKQLQSEKYKNLHIVFGMVNDKDIGAVLKLLPPNAFYYFTQASVKRALDFNELKAKAASAGLKGQSYPKVGEAIKAAQDAAEADDFLYIGGSNFIIADAMRYLGIK